VIDGKPDEADWLRAPKLDFLQFWEHKRPSNPGFVRVLWDDEFLYFSGELADDDLYADLTEHDSTTWLNDTFEIFLKPSENSSVYYELHVTPSNTTMDLMNPAKDARRFEFARQWESGMVTAVSIRGTLNSWQDRDEGWSIEMAIPWKAFTDFFPVPRAGDCWSFAACRFDYTVYGNGPIRSATPQFTSLSFHRLNEFDQLIFSDKP